jgi:hypothetical protein
MSNFKILSIFLVSGTYNSYQICHQICSRVKFVEQNFIKYRFCSISHTRPKAKLRIQVLFKKFHPRINPITLFFTKTYLLNTLKPFSFHEI